MGGLGIQTVWILRLLVWIKFVRIANHPVYATVSPQKDVQPRAETGRKKSARMQSADLDFHLVTCLKVIHWYPVLPILRSTHLSVLLEYG